MKRIERSVVIQRPINEVFAYLVEPANLPDWVPGILEAKSSLEGPIRVGSTSTRITNYGGRRAESQHVVSELEPNSRMAVSTKSGPLEIKELFELEAAGSGTRVTIAEEVSAPILLKPAEWIFALMVGKNFDTFGQALRDKMESSS